MVKDAVGDQARSDKAVGNEMQVGANGLKAGEAHSTKQQEASQEPGARTTSAAQSCAKGPSKSPPGLRGSPAAPEDSLGLGD